MRRPRDPTDEGPYDVFIAYARDDSKPFVTRLVRALEKRGLNVYVDFDDVRAGAEDWRKEIERGVELSHAFAFVVSPLSQKSSECSEELDLAARFGKRLLTILRSRPEEVDIVELDRRLRAPQWLPFPPDLEFEQCVDNLQKALAEDSEWIHKHTELLMLANRWKQDGCRRSQLLRGENLREAERWLANPAGAGRHPTKIQGEFIRASRRQLSHRQRGLIGVLGLGLAVAVGLLLWAVAAERSASSERNAAQSRALAAAALLNLLTSPESNSIDPDLSVLLAKEAVDKGQNRESESALRQSLAAFGGLGTTAQRLVGHSAALRDAAFTDDGRVIATAALDKTARLWRTSDGRQIGCVRATRPLDSVALSHNGHELAAGAADGTVWLWKTSVNAVCPATPSQPLKTFAPPTTSPEKNAFSVEFSGNNHLLSAHRSGDAYIWSTNAGQPVKHFRASAAALNSAAVSDDGSRVVTAGSDGIARVWSVSSQRQIAGLGHRGPALEMAAFDSSGAQVATAGDDGSVRVWRVDGGEQLNQLESGEKLYTVAFRPGSNEVLLGGFDSTARLWDPLTGQITGDFLGHADAVVRARFDRTGSRIVTASFDRTARIWNLPNQGIQLAGAGRVRSAEFSPDGKRIVTAGASGAAQIWTAFPLDPAFALPGNTALNDASFSEDGKQLITAGQDGSAHVWTLSTRRQLVLPGHRMLRSAEFSKDGQRAVTAGDGGVRIWSLTGAPHVVAQLSSRPTDAAAFSPDGKRVVTAGTDKVARIWQLSKPTHAIVLRGHLLETAGAEFDPTGRYVVTASRDGTAKIWNASNGHVAVKLRGHTEAANGASFSRPDGKLVVTAGDDDTARLWDASSGALVSLFPAPSAVTGAKVQPGGGKILITGRDGRARLYDCVACAPLPVLRQSAAARVRRSLTAAERKKYL